MGACGSRCRVGDLHQGATFMEKEIISALEKKKREMDAMSDKPTFNRIMLQFRKIKRIMGALEDIFESLRREGEKGLGVDQLHKLMLSLSVRLSKSEVEDLFKIADVDRSGNEHNVLDMQEFLVAIAVGYMLEAIPALIDRHEAEFSRDISVLRKSESVGTSLRLSTSRDRPRGISGDLPSPAAASKPTTPGRAQLMRDDSMESGSGPTENPGSLKEMDPEGVKGVPTRRSSREDLLHTWRSKREALRESEMRPPDMDYDHDEVSASATGIDARDSVVSLFDEGHVFNGDDIRHAIHLIICAYLLFDTSCRGFILKNDLNGVFRREGKGEGAPAHLSTDRWAEMDTDGDGRIMFQEFVFSFANWMDLGENEDSEDEAKHGGDTTRASEAKRSYRA